MTVQIEIAGQFRKGCITKFYFWGRTWHCLVSPINESFKVAKWVVLTDVRFDWTA